ncbi:MAG: methylenetetrahydrofolate reductase [NAD(P)H] [Kiloniellales bacterium]|nr:methylenetetrahydrofolate reductase [NAD(P)H] [Kiloniellales bacterium]
MNTLPRISLEFFPPAKPQAEAGLWQALERLGGLQPEFVSLTYGAGGTSRDRSDRILAGLLDRGLAEPAAHITCVAATRGAVDDCIRTWAEAGIRRLVALRGDMPELGAPFRPHPEGYDNAADLVAGLRRLGDFDISVGCYPEVHPDSPSLQADLDNLKRKLDAGAARAISQYFFDAEVFLRFRDRARRAGITQPIVPGILPIFHFGKVRSFSQRCGASVPQWLAARFDGLDGDPETRDLVAATTASELCQTLLREGVESFHFYTLNRAKLTLAICRMLGLRPQLEEAA